MDEDGFAREFRYRSTALVSIAAFRADECISAIKRLAPRLHRDVELSHVTAFRARTEGRQVVLRVVIDSITYQSDQSGLEECESAAKETFEIALRFPDGRASILETSTELIPDTR